MSRKRVETKPRRIAVLMHKDLVPPESIEGVSEEEMQEWKTEYDVIATLQSMGHDVRPLGVLDDLGVIRELIADWKPAITFNLLEEFHGVSVYDHYVVSYLELLRHPYTGCNPRGLMLSHDKALCKKILTYHRIPTPKFAVYARGKSIRIPRRQQFPMLVKSVSEEGSVGITERSIVHDEDALRTRIEYIFDKAATDALVEEYIEGRELYVGVMGNQRLLSLPIWELSFTNLPEGRPNIATSRAKWDYAYQKKVGVTTHRAKGLSAKEVHAIERLCKKVYRVLSLSGYARMDLRMRPDGRVYVLEANPNPNLSYGEDFAESAATAGIGFEALMQRIIQLGLAYRPEWRKVR